MANLTSDERRQLREALLEFMSAYEDEPETSLRKLVGACKDILADLALEDIATDVARGRWQDHFDDVAESKQFQEFYYRYMQRKLP